MRCTALHGIRDHENHWCNVHLHGGDLRMLRKHTAWLILIVGVVILLAIDWQLFSIVRSYEISNYSKGSYAHEENYSILKGPTIAFIVSLGYFLERHGAGITAISTLVVAFFTATLWRATDGLLGAARRQVADMRESLRIAAESSDAAKKSADAAEHSAKAATQSVEDARKYVERAYIYGGVGRQWPKAGPDGDIVAVGICITMANYGRTPGFIKKILVGICKANELPADEWPEHLTNIFWENDLYFPQMRMEELRETRAIVTVPIIEEHVIFQRVFFDDVFHRPHFSGSAYRFFKTKTDSFGHEPVTGKEIYWEWD